ncbi:Sucrose synthase 5 [Vitis vinifera]|uniref:sucrose synthase n=1 Tax=Vitis vinifera TaxID=29760 RepID=A0A438BWE9_VITVI|nr:Sucrose synthase 5 [Vitis vinifera]
MASKPTLKRADSMAENMPDALRQSRYHMKRCFARYIGKGKRLMKLNHLMDEMEAVIDDKNERTQVLEGVLGSSCVPLRRLWLFLRMLSFHKIKSWFGSMLRAKDDNALELNSRHLTFLCLA